MPKQTSKLRKKPKTKDELTFAQEIFSRLVAAGHCQTRGGQNKNREKKTFPAFYIPFTTRSGFNVKYRDFYFPPELYQTVDGKADVALKSRLAAALVRAARNENNLTREF